MGKGAVKTDGSSYEKQVSTHGQPLSAAGADFAATIKNLGGNPEQPFTIFPEVAELYAKAQAAKAEYVARKREEQKAWEAAQPELAAKLQRFFAPEADRKSTRLNSS